MANELAHITVGTELTQAEFEGTTLHQFNSQATGDIGYASSTTQISRLGIGGTGDTLTIASGIPAWNTVVQSNVTASRATNGTVYQNTSGRPLFVAVNVQLTTACASSSFDGYAEIVAYTDTANPPTTIVGELRQFLDDVSATVATGGSIRHKAQLCFFVLPSSYYKVTQDTDADSTVSLLYWFEWEI